MAFSRHCKQFSKTGYCHRKDCKLLHTDARPTGPQRLGIEENGIQIWKRAAHARCTFHIAPEFIEAFFVDARSLIERDAESMQEVIRHMSEERGLRYIQQLVEREFELLPSTARCDVFRAQMSPFLETISHPKVLSSLVAEHPLAVIYNFIYGIGGTRSAKLLGNICSVLRSLSEDNTTRAQWLEESLAVFYRIIFVNSTAFVQAGLREQAFKMHDILSTMDKGGMAKKLHVSHKYLTRILSRIETGDQMSSSQIQNAEQSQVITFVPQQ